MRALDLIYKPSDPQTLLGSLPRSRLCLGVFFSLWGVAMNAVVHMQGMTFLATSILVKLKGLYWCNSLSCIQALVGVQLGMGSDTSVPLLPFGK